MSRLKSAKSLLLVLTLCPAAFAQPVDPYTQNQFNWNETTGLINIPIARAMKRGTFYGAFDFKSKSVSNLFGSEFLGGNGDQGNGSFHFMFSPLRNVEIGVMGLHDVDRGGNVNTLGKLLKIPPASSFSTAIKVVLAEETENMPSIAVGVENLTYPRPRLKDGTEEPVPNLHFREPGYYAVGSKSFPVGDQLLSVHVGFGTGRFQNHPFAGLEYSFQNGLSLLAEYDGWTEAYGLRYTGLQNLRLTAAVQGGRPTVQIGYMVNPFDWFRDDVDDYDYNPYARPTQKPSDEPPDHEVPPPPDHASPDHEIPPAKSPKDVASSANKSEPLVNKLQESIRESSVSSQLKQPGVSAPVGSVSSPSTASSRGSEAGPTVELKNVQKLEMVKAVPFGIQPSARPILEAKTKAPLVSSRPITPVKLNETVLSPLETDKVEAKVAPAMTHSVPLNKIPAEDAHPVPPAAPATSLSKSASITNLPSVSSTPREPAPADQKPFVQPTQPMARVLPVVKYSRKAETSRPETFKLRPDADNPLPTVESLNP